MLVTKGIWDKATSVIDTGPVAVGMSLDVTVEEIARLALLVVETLKDEATVNGMLPIGIATFDEVELPIFAARYTLRLAFTKVATSEVD